MTAEPNNKEEGRNMLGIRVIKKAEDERKEMRIRICKVGARAISITQ
jgi:hypothetical protein